MKTPTIPTIPTNHPQKDNPRPRKMLASKPVSKPAIRIAG
jgi:hypothetical protein